MGYLNMLSKAHSNSNLFSIMKYYFEAPPSEPPVMENKKVYRKKILLLRLCGSGRADGKKL